MDKATFERLVNSPRHISENEAVQLEDLAKAFPYCQSAHALLARESHQKKSMFYPKKLRRASTYMVDRRVLYQLLHLSMDETNVRPIVQTQTEPEQLRTQKNISILEELEETLRETRKRLNMEPAVLDIAAIRSKTSPSESTKDIHLQKDTSWYRSESRLGEELYVDNTVATPLNLILDYLTSSHSSTSNEAVTPDFQSDVIDRFLENKYNFNSIVGNMLFIKRENFLHRMNVSIK